MGKHSAETPAWSKVPAPGEDNLPAPLSPVVKATADDAGCWVDGVRGWTAPVHMVDIAVARGWPITVEDARILEHARDGLVGASWADGFSGEAWAEIQDDAEDWLNCHVAPVGFSFGWHDMEFMLWSEASWCEASGDKCWCVEPHRGEDQ